MKCKRLKRLLLYDKVMGTALLVIALVTVFDLTRYILQVQLLPLVILAIVEGLFLLIGVTAWKGKLPWLLFLVGGFSAVLACTMNYAETTLYHAGAGIEAITSLAAAAAGTVIVVRERTRPQVKGSALVALALAMAIAAGALLTWKLGVDTDKQAVGAASRQIWAVPKQFDSVECSQPGIVEKLTYPTKAYATDQRDVEKTAYVYLPYGYDETKQYNILYLLHGTGDDEAYWLITNPYNKTMLDNLIANGDIDPLIVVTPTFYVEDDCADDLDQLTYSFREELRSDLMPVVESTYSTYADSIDVAGFTASRDHRAFAGLSRGAVTTYHSALCGSLDYFSWFGTFSGSRTDADYFCQTIQSEEFADYPIHYLYVSSGNFDFALPGQIQDYSALLAIEERLTEGVNTNFDVFPMRYHSMGNWHLALYNYLQKIF